MLKQFKTYFFKKQIEGIKNASRPPLVKSVSKHSSIWNTFDDSNKQVISKN
tara:strand:+ start:324 stop:476 length:153 start_codon:yes stop_codon:yes gene_type:complete